MRFNKLLRKVQVVLWYPKIKKRNKAAVLGPASIKIEKNMMNAVMANGLSFFPWVGEMISVLDFDLSQALSGHSFFHTYR